jgi:glycosyltransferase involved in cell wall biosynthesis
VCNSDATAAVFKEQPTLRGKTMTIYNAVDLSQYEEAGENRRAELGIDGSRPVIGFVGQIVPRKGVLTLITAMAPIITRVPNALLVVVGCPPPDETEYEAECRHLTEALGLQEHVRFMGYRRDVPAFMRTFDVFALPTRSEPFGKVVIEAMAGGAPVVASQVGGIPEIITAPELGTLIPADDPVALAEALVAYLVDPARRKDVASRAAASVQARFTMAAMLSQFQALYDEVLARRIGRRSASFNQRGAA